MSAKPIPLWQNILYHFLPGVAVTAVYVALSAAFPDAPKALLLYVSVFAFIPAVLPVLKAHSATGRPMGAVGYREKLPAWKTALLGIACFVWAGAVMALAKPVSDILLERVFFWMKGGFQMDAYAQNGAYPRQILILTWAVGLAANLVVVVAEERYFRGFLLRNMEKLGISAVFLSALLFSLYHLFSPWQFAVRFLAVLPMTYFVWRYKDIRIGIVCHLLLNLVGDSLAASPAVFGLLA